MNSRADRWSRFITETDSRALQWWVGERWPNPGPGQIQRGGFSHFSLLPSSMFSNFVILQNHLSEWSSNVDLGSSRGSSFSRVLLQLYLSLSGLVWLLLLLNLVSGTKRGPPRHFTPFCFYFFCNHFNSFPISEHSSQMCGQMLALRLATWGRHAAWLVGRSVSNNNLMWSAGGGRSHA